MQTGNLREVWWALGRMNETIALPGHIPVDAIPK